ncbi:MAG: ubiquinol-cytochrome C chaperone family protein [Hyphomicrobiaceae bacterium]
MLGWLKGRSELRRRAEELYGRIVAQARQPDLYLSCGVPDTMDGRLEMVLLHTVLVLERLKTAGAEGQRLGQRLMEVLVSDMDDALRRIGIGDDGVAMRIGRLAGALSERARDYGLGFADVGRGDDRTGGAATLEAALMDHVYRAPDAAVASEVWPLVRALAAYVRRARETLGTLPTTDVLAARVVFPMEIAMFVDKAEARS